ncbi:MAG: DUF4132 domain-containing protein [Dactylosporangium sp.]|nr:DUF4132 domain-containing protein [Dactylosporangium sp.]NNJ60740.1 DUF4132 domain-containing protein [Dactylosporangium sp.]
MPNVESTGRLSGAQTDLPGTLIDPVWAAEQGLGPAVVEGLVTAVEDTAQWRSGEREAWGNTWLNWPSVWADPDPDRMVSGIARFKDKSLLPEHEPKLLVKAPTELVRPLLAKWRPQNLEGAAPWARVLIARFGADAIPVALKIAKKSPALGGELLQPLTGPAIARLMADWLVARPSQRPAAVAWLDRHPAVAAEVLVPEALGAPGLARSAAEETLRVLTERGHREAVLAAAAGHGPAARDATGAILAIDRLEAPPARTPKPPKWLDLAKLPPLLLTTGTPVPQPAVALLCAILALPDVGEVAGRVGTVSPACDPTSLAAFSWGLLEQWQSGAGTPPAKDAWTITAVGLLGGDDEVRRLVELIHDWADSGKGARAVKGLDALGAIGSDIALMYVDRISRTSKVKRLKTRAGNLLAEIARQRQLSDEQLADRVVPRFGLDTHGSMTLDYGPRRFTVGFDEQLKPWVADDTGARRAQLPKPSAKDDPALAPEAHARFAALRRDVRAIAADQIRRMERALVERRRWSAEEFQRLLVDHPLLWHLARRLLWGVPAPDGRLRTAFRVAEDRSLADADDEAFMLDPAASVGIVHPVELGDGLAGWAELFADYEIIQPFPQLGRGVFALTAEEGNAAELSRFEGIEVPTGKLLGLRSRGWQLCIGDDGTWERAERAVCGGTRTVRVSISPGIPPAYVAEHPKQTLDGVRIDGQPGDGDPARFGDLDALGASEILRDLGYLVS